MLRDVTEYILLRGTEDISAKDLVKIYVIMTISFRFRNTLNNDKLVKKEFNMFYFIILYFIGNKGNNISFLTKKGMGSC